MYMNKLYTFIHMKGLNLSYPTQRIIFFSKSIHYEIKEQCYMCDISSKIVDLGCHKDS